MKTRSLRKSSGFALISTLAILVIVTILVVAYASTMRAERAASQNFSDRERAQAIAQGMLNRILADHAAPLIADSKPLKPYADPEYYDDKAKLPYKTSPYISEQPKPGIFTLTPQAEISHEFNTLVRLSMPDQGQAPTAFTPADWAYMRQKVEDNDPQRDDKIEAFYPHSSESVPVAPQWVDFFETLDDGSNQPSDVASGQVAFVIWDESGKIDINMAGADTNVNGMAPHDLRLENLSLSAPDLLEYLNGNSASEKDKNKPRQRSNFSLRTISGTTDNDTGNDRWFFTDEELLARKLVEPRDAALNVTTVSRDFDVRPEWDGDRTGVKAQKFLRSYINNPDLFALFTTDSPLVSAALVAKVVTSGGDVVGQDVFDREAGALTAVGGLAENWNQVLHLMAVLRTSLPPYRPTTLANPATTPLAMTQWYDEDIFGIVLNILQGTSPAADQNLIAYNRASFPRAPFSDPTCRVGVRISPYVTEIAMRLVKKDATNFEATEYLEIWNPYAFPMLKPGGGQIQYTYGEFTGSEWPTFANAIYGMTNTRGYSTPGGNPPNIPAPAPGGFTVVKLPPRTINYAPTSTEGARIVTDKGFFPRVRTYLQNYDYFVDHIAGGGQGVDESTSYAMSSGPLYTSGTDNRMFAFFPKIKMDALMAGTKPVLWYSFQIDDPRMGGATRSVAVERYQDLPPFTTPGFEYSWVAFEDTHSLYDLGPDTALNKELEMLAPLARNDGQRSGLSRGYNQNFGANWPAGEPFSLNRALSTFALPGRPYANVAEMGSVFALRPWRTLSFGLSTAPTDLVLNAASQGVPARNYPANLLDYITTIGNTTSSRKLNFQTEAPTPAASQKARAVDGILHTVKRQQDLKWLFDKVGQDNLITSASNIRPIRGRINLNSASKENISRLLQAPYRLVPSVGLVRAYPPSTGNGWVDTKGALTTGTLGAASTLDLDYQVTIDKQDADDLATAIALEDTSKGIRPLRSLADLGKLDLTAKAGTLMRTLRGKYPDAIMDAIMGRLAQFGTVRQQYYTVDMIVQALNPNAEKRRKTNASAPRVVTAEVRMLARVYFDTFSRKAYIESLEFR